MLLNEYSLCWSQPSKTQNANRAVYSGWPTSGGDGLTNCQFASPPVATRNGLAMPARIGAPETARIR